MRTNYRNRPSSGQLGSGVPDPQARSRSEPDRQRVIQPPTAWAVDPFAAASRPLGYASSEQNPVKVTVLFRP